MRVHLAFRACGTSVLHLLLIGTAGARTIRVPSEYPTIGLGLGAAASGDTVAIACGVYPEHGLVLRDGVMLRSDTGEPGCVTIDGQHEGTVLLGPVGLGARTVVEGVTITGRYWQPAVEATGKEPAGDGSRGGGGISLFVSGATFRRCVIRANTAESVGAGGVYVGGGGPSFIDCAFVENVGGRGGGAGVESADAVFYRCEFSGNQGVGGGAIIVYTVMATHSPAPLREQLPLTGTRLEKCTLSSNRAPVGGALVVADVVSVRECSFVRNASYIGSAVYTIWGSATIENTIIAFGQFGEALQCEYPYPNSAILSCCDLFGNQGGDWVGCIADQVNLRGNFSADPMFCDLNGGDFHLSDRSPCAPENSPGNCGRIGAWPVGCSTSALSPSTWGRVKVSFLPR